MPLISSGQGYRTWADPRFYVCELASQVQQIELPVDKAFCFVAAADGSVYNQWRFDGTSTAGASATVIVPDNPLFATTGRWIKLPTPGGGGGGSGGLQSGSGDPEGVADASAGQFYFNTDVAPTGQSMWANLSTSGTSGWFLLFQF